MIGRLSALLSASSLGFRLGTTLVLALLPLGVLSIVQSQISRMQNDQTTLEGIGGASLAAVQPQIDLIHAAQTTVKVVAHSLGGAIPEDTACIAKMRAIAQSIPEATVVAYIPMSGQLTCSSTGTRYDFSGNPIFAQMIARPEPTIIYNPHGPVSVVAVIGISHPVFDAAGAQLGVAAISLPNRAVTPNDYSSDTALWQPKLIVAITGDGTQLVTSDTGTQMQPLLPADLTLEMIKQRAGQPFFATGQDGQSRIMSVINVAQNFFILAAWQRKDGGNWGSAMMAPYVLPALTWAATLVAAALASGRLVVRHVRSLSRAMTAYSQTRTRTPLRGMDEAPTEIQSLHAVYNQLIQTIEHDEAELQNLLVDKDLLLKEVHHRNGNSLQIIAAVMRMYRRETADPGLRKVLDGLINRVIALSSTHTSLYSLAGRRDVPMDEILFGVVRRLKEIHGISVGTATKRFEPIRMPVEAAVPLALVLAETVSCHFTAQTGLQRGVEVSLTREGDTIRLLMIGPDVPEFRPENTFGTIAIPRRILTQFAAQLRGQLVIRIEDERSIVDLTFPQSAAAPTEDGAG